ncbi:GNAT family N-acetyltransferase [Hyphomicrobium sulfonivorans]|uniref:GNAT family N-acetyltransferase n=1 Tax=Hyphomicrobium sulfonivorans TaxID=121290 RepID=UPI0015700304|nr:GNAT family N-acetyltransferase [Hyphomicrobium sulfonivorans]MBI1650646.1 GNAT family N-acetyltransferase [Hyphomicrobium sulfonivorans]NSL71995.1 GNAT family N-acetyltransferase [Hyphomicrobium sulfonivorans]
MSAPARYAASSYELPPLTDGAALELTSLDASDAERLGVVFAAMDPWHSYGYPAAPLQAMMTANEPGIPCFAIRLDGNVVGAILIQPLWLRGPYLRFLALEPVAQNRGVGGALLAWLESEARAAGERNLWVVASQINTGGIRFYERAGFHQAAAFDGLAYDDRVELLFRKRLAD